MIRFLSIAVSLCVFFVAHPTQAEESFRVCADPVNPPLSDKEQMGFENKIAQLFAKELGQEVTYTWFPQRLGFLRNTLKAKDPETKTYKCDVVIGVPAGYELAATTKPYYRSTYVLVVAKGKGFDDIHSPEQLEQLPPDRKKNLKIAMFDRTPGVTWLLRHHLLKQGKTYQAMTGDLTENTAMRLEKAFAKGDINMAIVWGPIGAYLPWKHPDDFELIPLKSEKGIRFNYAISMAVRRGDKERQQQLQNLLNQKHDAIIALLREYKVPLVDQEGNPL